MEHKYGHRDLVDMMNRLGFCSSYTEASRYTKNAASSHGVDILGDISDTFVQYQADNIDHVSRTLDGSGKIHVMGQMATFTPARKTIRIVPRANVNKEERRKIGLVHLVTQTNPKAAEGRIVYTKLGEFSHDENSSRLDMLWRVSRHFSKQSPLWSGWMQIMHANIPHPGKSSIMFLPLIDMTPSDPTCVRSTLEYLSDHARRNGQTPIITFDQQLWWIAYTIIESQPMDSPLRECILVLGGFLTEMSFLGTIGSLMAGSDFRVIMSQMYA